STSPAPDGRRSPAPWISGFGLRSLRSPRGLAAGAEPPEEGSTQAVRLSISERTSRPVGESRRLERRWGNEGSGLPVGPRALRARAARCGHGRREEVVVDSEGDGPARRALWTLEVTISPLFPVPRK